jgi:type III pantothenate kinase
MSPDVVVDVGNTRSKWGRCEGDTVCATVSLPSDGPEAWEAQYRAWQLTPEAVWAVAGVSPPRVDQLVQWLKGRAGAPLVVSGHLQLPLAVVVDNPAAVGIDRLLDAVAATRLWGRTRLPAVIIDAGTAVTVDLVDGDGVFRGGAILPGFRLMARALHDHTALLPLVEAPAEPPFVPAINTAAALRAGVFYAVVGGVNAVVARLLKLTGVPTHIYLTGGDAPLLTSQVDARAEVWPEMTLEGLRLTAEALP